jgi:hypothetical protein
LPSTVGADGSHFRVTVGQVPATTGSVAVSTPAGCLG